MKYLALILCFVVITAHATTVDCYSGGKNVYHGEAESVIANKDYILVAYEDYSDVIFRKRHVSPDLCLVKHIIEPAKKK